MELLEMILEKSGAQYISDLSGMIQEKEVLSVLKEINIHTYELVEWQEAILYLTGGKTKITTEKDLQGLIDKL
ncbi:MAG: hypothetical protein RR237_03795 [Acetivibrio sp.]